MLSKCWEEEDWGGEGGEKRESPACARLQPSPHRPTARCRFHGSRSATVPPARQGAARRWPSPSPGCWRRAALGPPSLQKQKAEGPSPCRLQKSPYATHPNCFCPCGSWPWWSGDWWRWGAVTALALPPAAGCWRWEALCLRWAQFTQTLRMLLWRWWEGVGRRREEKGMNQAQHHKPKFTQIPASHPPYLSPPPEPEDSDNVLQHFRWKKHTNKQHPLTHSKNLTALYSQK